VSGAFLTSVLISVVFYQYIEVPSLNFAQKVAIMVTSKKSKQTS